ncbi:MAG: hypothetical protein ABR514_06485, partial [Chthoniobacterales bacterium]
MNPLTDSRSDGFAAPIPLITIHPLRSPFLPLTSQLLTSNLSLLTEHLPAPACHVVANPRRSTPVRTRRDFLSLAGKSLGLAALSSATVASLLKDVEAATKTVAHLTPEEAATDEDYWATIQNSFSVTRGIINLNNGGVSPSPRIVTEALVRYIWEQEDATAYTMWQILEPQSETIRTGL